MPFDMVVGSDLINQDDLLARADATPGVRMVKLTPGEQALN